jgi:CHAT domain-containing protein
VAGGEGVLGLQRAFHAAGARSLCVSLWSVSDAATSVLMEEFYANLWQKRLSRAEALRQAQLTVLRNPAQVAERDRALYRELADRGVPRELLSARRGVSRTGDSGAEPDASGRDVKRSHPALWAAFVLSGEFR